MDILGLLAGYYYVGLLESKGDRLEGAGNWNTLGHVVQL